MPFFLLQKVRVLRRFLSQRGTALMQRKCTEWEENRCEKLQVACIACPIACAHWTVLPGSGGMEIKAMEVTPHLAFGAQCDINNISDITRPGTVTGRKQ